MFFSDSGYSDNSMLRSIGTALVLVFAAGIARGEPMVQVETLKGAYSKWFDIGAALPSRDLSEQRQKLLVDNFTAITPGNCMKFDATEPAEGKFAFADADRLVERATQNHLKVNGHTLVWHSQCPAWVFIDGGKPAGAELVQKRMRDHINGEVGHFRGKVFSWDVVNEVVSDKPGEYLRSSKWFTSLGEDFIADAFNTAHAADPAAELYLNDYGIEQPTKRDKAIRLIRDLQKKHIPIDGVGIQGHLQLDHISYKNIEDAIVAFHGLGLKVMITELDIDMVPRSYTGADVGHAEAGQSDPYATGCPADVLARQADQYAKLFALFRKHSDKITRVTFWGLEDGDSWLNTWPSRRTNYPLLFGRDLQPKPAFTAVIDEGLK